MTTQAEGVPAPVTVGVLGGMGPAATVELQRRIIAATPAMDDADHIRVITDNNPHVPSRIAALLEGGDANPVPVLAAMARGLADLGADFLVMPCNTAHHYIEQIANAVEVPVWNLIDLTVSAVHAQVGQGGCLGLLASPAVRRVRLYEPYCEQFGLRLLHPQAETDLLAVIRLVKAGQAGTRERRELDNAIHALRAQGADAVVLGCTEYSLLPGSAEDAEVPVFDTLDLLAMQVVAAARAGRVTPSAH